MSLPSPALPLPSLTTWQLSYGGLPFGGVTRGATYQLMELPGGLDTPSYLTGDVQRALDQGEYAGLDLSPGRDITVKQSIGANSAKALDEARQAFAAVIGPQGSTEQPLYLQLASGLFACMARPRKHAFTVGVPDVFAHVTQSTTLWHAIDPRWYLMPTLTSTVGLPEPSGGLIPPVTPPVTIKGAGAGGLIEVNNTGGFEMRPVLVFTGPCTNPKATNLSLPGAPSVAFTITLNAGDQLTVDLDWQSAVLVTAGSTAGSSRRSSEKAGTTWWNTPPGVSIVQFTTEDVTQVAGTLTVEWAPARMGL